MKYVSPCSITMRVNNGLLKYLTVFKFSKYILMISWSFYTTRIKSSNLSRLLDNKIHAIKSHAVHLGN